MRKATLAPWLLGLALAQSAQTYTVQRGDTLYSIARRHETTVETLMQLNQLQSSALRVGQVLVLPSKPVLHTVQRGETLYSIARRYGSSVEAIQRENDLSSTTIAPGQVLRVPQGALTSAPPPAGASAVPTHPVPLPSEPVLPSDTDYNPQHPLVLVVLKYLGLPYVFGASSDRAVDCSAFVQQVFSEIGIRLPRTSQEQWAAFPTVQGALRQGDLVFFSFGGRVVDHVGIYLGRGVFAHANSYGSRVVVESLDSPFYKRVYRGAKRVEALQGAGP
ncbi:MAG: LysM peptidoglycan-binding domain-containing protein [Meiothermus sp.]|uniref:C40 family peptidase n=1 Tax=Meiothermus sp. TaxID=1955249 RepID=UPI00298F38F2|nr:LysM peptidoglycan-binding domain-containing protein [Meiothermus sp.]MDW8482271.1 LysM peptidoglycan-binding domain-containing protein [Meiothermus sp.]